MLILSYILMQIDVNVTTWMQNPFYWSLEPFALFFGGMENVLAIFLGYGAGAVYIGTQKNGWVTTLYMLMCIFFFLLYTAIAPLAFGIMAIFTLLSAFTITAIVKDRFTGSEN